MWQKWQNVTSRKCVKWQKWLMWQMCVKWLLSSAPQRKRVKWQETHVVPLSEFFHQICFASRNHADRCHELADEGHMEKGCCSSAKHVSCREEEKTTEPPFLFS